MQGIIKDYTRFCALFWSLQLKDIQIPRKQYEERIEQLSKVEEEGKKKTGRKELESLKKEY